METSAIPLLGMTLNELKQVASLIGMPAFAAKQMASWIYDKKINTIEEMTNLSVNSRHLLKETYTIGCSAPVENQRSTDGTVKYLYKTVAGDYIESVYIPDKERATLCVSSQVGCRMNCKFCMTGKQGFSANLSATDILNQIYSLPERDKLTNVVFMGQGEPFDNLDHVLQATEILTADYGWAWSPRRITVSSVGLKKGLKRFLDHSECHLAISLHNAFSQQRRSIMPAEGSYPMAEMISLLQQYDFAHQRRLSFEYIIFEGVNDSMQHAQELVRLLKGLDCRVNLIRFHPIPDVDLQGADEKTMTNFRDYLTNHGVFTTIRASRGQDIFAACGLLSTARQQELKK